MNSSKNLTVYLLVFIAVLVATILGLIVYDRIEIDNTDDYVYFDKSTYILRLNTVTGKRCLISDDPLFNSRKISMFPGLNPCRLSSN